jgi:hypothetical protein
MECGIVAMGSAHYGSQSSLAQISWPILPFDPGAGVGESTGRQWSAKFQRLPTMRCNGEGSRSKMAWRRTGFGATERRGLTRGACPWQRGSTVGEECWQAGVEVTDGVGMVGEELLGDAKLGVGRGGSRNGRRRLTLVRSLWWSGE